jgi:hypothetical protein
MISAKLKKMQTFSFYVEWIGGKRKGTTEIVNISAISQLKALEHINERYEEKPVKIIDRSELR